MSVTEIKSFKLTIPSDPANLSKVDNLCTKAIKYCNMKESDGDDFAIAVTELVNNAIHHGNRNDTNKNVLIFIKVYNNKVEARIKDEGNGFNPNQIGDPLDPENIMKESGRGIFLIKRLTDSLNFNFTSNGTEMIITKNIN